MRIPVRLSALVPSRIVSAGLLASTLPLLAGLTGCGAGTLASVAASPSLAGNWSVSTAAAPASSVQIASLGGALTVSASGTVSGMLHTVALSGQKASALCYAPASSIAVTGTYTSDGKLTLTSSDFAGNRLTAGGTYVPATATTPASLTNGTFTITGPCGVATQPLLAIRKAAISGNYTGTFTSDGGPTIPVSASLTQTTQADANGTFHLTGSATFPGDSCIASPVVTDSTVTGSAFSATYTDATSHATVVATGTFNNLATALTIDKYTLTGAGSCTDTGHGTLSQ